VLVTDLEGRQPSTSLEGREPEHLAPCGGYVLPGQPCWDAVADVVRVLMWGRLVDESGG
jgi:hypothetical protein